MITRVATEANSENYAKKWHPKVETSMLHMHLSNKARLLNYVLHAKHSNYKDRLDEIIVKDLKDEAEDSGEIG